MGKVSRADLEKRLDKTVELLAFHTHDMTIRQLCEEFDIVKQTASKWIRQVRVRILNNIQKPRDEWVAETLHQLNEIIRTDPDKRLEALKQRTCLLGLNAPTKIKLLPPGVYCGPDQWTALGNAAFLKKAMALEIEYARVKVTANGHEQGNGGGPASGAPDPLAEQLGVFGLPPVSVSESPPDPPEGGPDSTALPAPQPPDRPDARPEW